MRRARAVRALPAGGAAVLAPVLVSLLLAACGLPVPGGVQRAGAVAAQQRVPQPISVLPPGPQPGATPQQVVLGFLAAQSSARDAHGVARSFLAVPARPGWRDAAGVTVHVPGSAVAGPAQQAGAGEVQVTLTLQVVGDVGVDGAARVLSPQVRSQRYRLRREGGEWRLAGAPPGTSLTPAARDRSYDAVRVQFLAPPGGPGSTRHLVPDLVRLPVEGDRADEVVQHLLDGPSNGLGDSAVTAFPAGTVLRAPVGVDAAGEVVVDVSGPARTLSDRTRADLSAQLVWTLRDALPDFTRLRLLVDGQPLAVPGVDEPQPRTSWSTYAPDGPEQQQAGLTLVGGTLRSLARVAETRPTRDVAPVSGAVDLAVDARRGQLAVLTDDGAVDTVRTGPLSGPLTPALSSAALASPTWGSGDLGLFVLRTGARPAVLLLPQTSGAGPVEVEGDDLPALDASSELRVSLDGSRVALVAGGVLQVGRLVLDDEGRPRMVDLQRLATEVLDVAWRTGTTLEVLVRDASPPLLPLVELSVDGTSVLPRGLVGVAEGTPVALAAFGDQPLLVETRSGSRSTLYGGEAGLGFRVELPDARRPAYPR